MKAKHAPLVAAVFFLGVGVVVQPASAQLPPTNMGKWIKQPGDNQYTAATGLTRHGSGGYIDTGGGGSVYVKKKNPAPMPMAQSGGSGGGGGYSAGAVPMGGSVVIPRVDISLEPIAADEPVPPGGFPPLPERLDLPVKPGDTWGALSRASASGGGGGGGGSAEPSSSMHQHYKHVAPGAYKMKPSGGGGGGGGGGEEDSGWGAGDGGGGGGGGGSSSSGNGVGYYKCKTAPSPGRSSGGGGDTFAVSTTGKGATAAAPKGRPSDGGGGGGGGFGKAPVLDPKADVAGAPEAPTPVIVNQPTTQDLSLPDDDYTSGQFKNNRTKRFLKRAGKRVVRSGVRMGRRALRQGTGGIIGF